MAVALCTHSGEHGTHSGEHGVRHSPGAGSRAVPPQVGSQISAESIPRHHPHVPMAERGVGGWGGCVAGHVFLQDPSGPGMATDWTPRSRLGVLTPRLFALPALRLITERPQGLLQERGSARLSRDAVPGRAESATECSPGTGQGGRQAPVTGGAPACGRQHSDWSSILQPQEPTSPRLVTQHRVFGAPVGRPAEGVKTAQPGPLLLSWPRFPLH